MTTLANVGQAIAAAGLVVVGRLDARPTHPRARDTADLLHTVRTREITSLWQLQAAG